MAIADELLMFVKDALARGISRTEIEEVLLKAKWPTADVKGVLARFSESDFPLPVPRPKPNLSAREAFLYLLLFSTLYFSASHLGALLFEFIDLAFPNPDVSVTVLESISSTMRWAISSLIVALPVYLYLSWFTGRETRKDPTKRASKVRRWLTYLTLFVGAAILIGDLTALIYNFLSDELTMRFVLKVLTVGVIAGSIFAYYLRDLRLDE